jgi:hypothetical protein
MTSHAMAGQFPQCPRVREDGLFTRERFANLTNGVNESPGRMYGASDLAAAP